MSSRAFALCRRPNRRRLWTILLGCLASLIAGWVAGLLWFAGAAGRMPPSPPPETDGIVALTGGATRIETALQLLARGHGHKLLISGVGSAIDLTTLAQRAGLDPEPLADRVTLGRAATSTRGNAAETAAWAAANHIHSLIVVTAYYHMPRALTELHRTMPEIRLFPWPVLLSNGADPRSPVTMRLLIDEYNKYLVSVSGLSAWLPAREPARVGRPG